MDGVQVLDGQGALEASLRTLERCFRRETGVPLGTWRRRHRLLRARRLLQDGRPSTEVALDVGYASPSAFARAYREQFGLGPAETVTQVS